MTEKIMQPIFFVELCSQITSRVVFRSYKPICTFIWMPSKYTQMSLKPNHYLEPCLTQLFDIFRTIFFWGGSKGPPGGSRWMGENNFLAKR